MNALIELLAVQATTYIEPTSNSGEGWIFDKEKFAELIVKECVWDLKESQNREYGLTESIKRLEQHFGVEE